VPDCEQVFSGKIFNVERCTYQVDGSARTFDIIRHPGAAVVLPLLPNGDIVFEQIYRYPMERTLLELPAGTLDPPEDPIDCAKRELTEETGYRAGRVEPLLSFFSTSGVSDEKMYAFLATDLTPGESALEPGEQITLTHMPLEVALTKIEAGEICDAKSIATLLYYAARVR
jgi:ADP-ribose pyrophosphatase